MCICFIDYVWQLFYFYCFTVLGFQKTSSACQCQQDDIKYIY